MSDEEFLKWAIDLIEKGVEIMTVEQLSKWEGVRAFLDTVSYPSTQEDASSVVEVEL